MKRVILSVMLLLGASLLFGCGGPAAAGSANDSPTEAYKRLYKAVKSKDTEAIKREMTAKTLDFAQMVSQRNNTPIEKVFENGFTATTFATSIPEIRDQRLNGDQGAIEVWNSKDSKWEDLPFINENGGRKLAIGDLFAGTFKSPGKARSILEQEAANAAGAGPVAVNPTANANMPTAPSNSKNPVPEPSSKGMKK